MKGTSSYTIGNMQNDPPAQRAWIRKAAAFACVFSTRFDHGQTRHAAVGTVMLAADYLWERDADKASFTEFDADGFTKVIAGRFFGPHETFEEMIDFAVLLEGWIRQDPSVLDNLPTALIEETRDRIVIPLGPAARRPTLREELRAAAQRVRARGRKGRRAVH